MQNVLFITNKTDARAEERSQLLETFAQGVSERAADVSVTSCAVQELLFAVQNGECHITLSGRELREDYHVVYLRNAHKYTDYANALRLYCQATGIKLINAEDLVFPYYGKVSQGFLFALSDLPTPDLVSSISNRTLLNYLKSTQPGHPFILKHNEGVKGMRNYLVTSEEQLDDILNAGDPGYVVQPYISNIGELRVLTFGREQAPMIFRKNAAPGMHLNNTSQGSTAEIVRAADVPTNILSDALRAAQVTNREIGGVDVLLHDDDTWYILEVNHTPALASGVLSAEKQQAFIDYIHNLGDN